MPRYNWDEIEKAHQNGAKVPELVERFGISRATWYKHLKTKKRKEAEATREAQKPPPQPRQPTRSRKAIPLPQAKSSHKAPDLKLVEPEERLTGAERQEKARQETLKLQAKLKREEIEARKGTASLLPEADRVALRETVRRLLHTIRTGTRSCEECFAQGLTEFPPLTAKDLADTTRALTMLMSQMPDLMMVEDELKDSSPQEEALADPTTPEGRAALIERLNQVPISILSEMEPKRLEAAYRQSVEKTA